MSSYFGGSRIWVSLCHISALSMFFFPLGNIWGPLVIWLLKRDESEAVDRHGRASLNFQITVTLFYFLASISVFVLMFVVIGIFLLPLLWIFLVVGPIIDSIFILIAFKSASEGKWYRYPASIPFF